MTTTTIRTPRHAALASASTAELLRFERLVSELSARFIDMPAADIDIAIDEALRRIVELLGVDRSTLSGVVAETGHLATLHSFAAEGLPALPKSTILTPLRWVLATARAGRPIVFASLDDLPPEASEAKEWYARHGLRSHVGVPVLVAGELVAILGFGTLRAERAWAPELVERLRLVAEIFASALARKRAHEDIERALGFERLLADISASLVTQRYDDPGEAIRSALRAIGEFLRVDRVTLWRHDAEAARVEASHEWATGGAGPSPACIDASLAPVAFRTIVGGAVAVVSSRDEPLNDGPADAVALAALGARSLLAVPLVVDGFVVGALSLSAVRERRMWPSTLVPRVRLIGEVFANLLTRQRAALAVHKAQSETAQYRERLAHLVRVHTVGEMSAAIAHEVNQPLMAIENYALAAQRRLTSPGAIDSAKLDDLLRKIGTQAGRAGDVLKRLRSIVRKHESEATWFDVGALIADTMALVEMESRLKDVRIEIAVAPELPRVYADFVQIQQVVLNLARNGMEAMDGSGTPDKALRVDARAVGRTELAVCVSDRGIGINAADAEHLFEPFYSTKLSGLGIGLAICRSIVEAHGGRLFHTPVAGGGAAFQFTLPISSASHEDV
jgi:signal transduction histidine kinase